MADASVARTARSRRFRFAPRDWLVWAAFFLAVVSLRLVLVANFGSAMPLMDQWDDEGARIFQPYLEGTLQAEDLFAAHNEHRHLLARLVALALLKLNGQWDAHLQMVVNAVIAAVAAMVLGLIGVRCLGAPYRAIVLAAVATWSGFPYAWENTTWAFQSSFYFLLLFSLVAIWGLTAQAAFSGRWVLGATAALLSCFTMASGFLAAAAVLLLVILRTRARRTQFRDSVATAAVCAVVIALGFALRVHVPDHDPLRADSIAQFVEAFARCLSWPLSQQPLACVVVYAPVALLAATYFWRTKRTSSAGDAYRVELILGLAVWVALQAAAIAYARGGVMMAGGVSSRYMDVLGVGVLGNLFAVGALIGAHGRGRAWLVIGPFIAACWTAALFLNVIAVSYKGYGQMSARAEQVRQAEAQVRAYLAAGDARRLAGSTTEIAYPWPDRFVTLLKPDAFRRILPAAIRQPLTLKPDGNSSAFVLQTTADEERIWSSEIASHDARGEMRTQPLTSSLPRLRLALRGALGPQIALKFHDEERGRERGASFTKRENGWRVGYARVDSPFRVIARDDDDARSIAFTEPVELGTLSYFAERLLANSRYLLTLAAAMIVALATHAHLRRHSAQPDT